MLLGGYSSCQGCGCVPCKTCTRTCTEPHSGAAFETVFTNYFEGVEVGNPSDGFLTATGDNDTSDPYDGMDGSGPWMQQVGGAFNDGGSYGGGTRFPCTYRFSFWRSTRQLGINNPAPSTALTENVIELTVSAGAVVYPDGTVITPASGTVTLASIPLVSGGAGAVDPRTGEGSVSFALQCQNVETTFSIQARVRWNVQKRQHTVYGIVRECYQGEGGACDTFCSGSPAPSEMYLTISGVSTASEVHPNAGASSSSSLSFLNGTYVVSEYLKTYGVCDSFLSIYQSGQDDPNMNYVVAINVGLGPGYPWPYATPVGDFWLSRGVAGTGAGTLVYNAIIILKNGKVDVCSSTSGTGSVHLQELPVGGSSRYFLGTCSWTLTP